MAPKTPASRQPSKDQENKTPVSDEEDDDSQQEVEEEDDETEEASSSEDDEDTDLQKQKVEKNIKFESKPIAQEDGSDSDPDSDDSPSGYKLQPITKPSSASAKRDRAKRIREEGKAAASGSCKKSKVEEKKNSSSVGSKVEEKKSSSSVGGSTRVWSNENEITVLNQMIEFRNKEQVDPTSDMLAFYNSIKGKLQGDFSKEQLKTKISGLKKRFFNAMKKGQNGADPVFSKPHDDWVFELSKKIWGGGNDEGVKKIENNAKGKERKKDNAKEKVEEVVSHEKEDVKELDFWSKYKSISESFGNLAVKFPSLAMSETWMRSVMEKLSLIGNADAKELNDKWKKLIMEETELNYKMMNLMNEQLKMAFGQ